MAQHCKHECCNCDVPTDRTDDYCSEGCRDRGVSGEHVCKECPCGHLGCRTHHESATSTGA